MRDVVAWLFMSLDGVVEAPENWVLPDEDIMRTVVPVRRGLGRARNLKQRGGTRVADMDEYGYTWTVMADPEGNEFCVAKAL